MSWERPREPKIGSQRGERGATAVAASRNLFMDMSELLQQHRFGMCALRTMLVDDSVHKV